MAATATKQKTKLSPEQLATKLSAQLRQRVGSCRNHAIFQGALGEADAYVFGVQLAALTGSKWASNRAKQLGLTNVMTEDTDTAGGFLVPKPIGNEIIRLVEEFGVFRRYARVLPMISDMLSVPRGTSRLTVYHPGEGVTITPDDLTFGHAFLVAKKYAVLTKMSRELHEDSVISLATLIAEEIAYAISVAEDTNGFHGDGTIGFAQVIGLRNALNAGSFVTAASGHTTVADLDKRDFQAVQGAQLKVLGSQDVWFVHKDVYYTAMAPFMISAGGNTITDIANGAPPRFLGHPVVFTEVLPRANAAPGSIVAYYGDLSLAATMGSRRDVRVMALEERYAETNEIGIQGTSRTAITVHERGTATQAGPVIALKLAE